MTKTTKESIATHAVKLELMHDDIKEVKELVKLQNGRVRKLENNQSWLAGGLSLLAFLLGLGALKMFGG